MLRRGQFNSARKGFLTCANTLLTAAAAAAFIATPAFADGPYVGIEGGVLFPNKTSTVDVDITVGSSQFRIDSIRPIAIKSDTGLSTSTSSAVTISACSASKANWATRMPASRGSRTSTRRLPGGPECDALATRRSPADDLQLQQRQDQRHFGNDQCPVGLRRRRLRSAMPVAVSVMPTFGPVIGRLQRQGRPRVAADRRRSTRRSANIEHRPEVSLLPERPSRFHQRRLWQLFSTSAQRARLHLAQPAARA